MQILAALHKNRGGEGTPQEHGPQAHLSLFQCLGAAGVVEAQQKRVSSRRRL